MKISFRLKAWLGTVIHDAIKDAIQANPKEEPAEHHAPPQTNDTTDSPSENKGPLLSRVFPGLHLSDYAGWIGLFAALLPIAISTLRLFMVARFDVNNALILAANINLTAVFIAAIPGLGVMILGMGYMVLMVSIAAVQLRWWIPAITTAIYVTTTVMLANLVFATILFFTLFATLSLYRKMLELAKITKEIDEIDRRIDSIKKSIGYTEPSIESRQENHSGQPLLDSMAPLFRKLSSTFAIAFVVMSLIGGGLAGDAWLPREVVYLKSAGPREVYVLDVTDHDMTVLNVSRDSVYIVRQDEITGRRICNRKDSDLPLLHTLNMTVADLIFRPNTRSFVGDC